MVRASVLHTEGQRFESSIAHHRASFTAIQIGIRNVLVCSESRPARRRGSGSPPRQFVFAAITKDTGVFRSATNL